MSHRRTQKWVVRALLLGTTLTAVELRGESAPERIPPLVRYAALPKKFEEVLQVERAAAIARPDDPEEMRKLARLYHANRLYTEARACYRIIAALQEGLTAKDHYYLADIAQNENNLAGAQLEFRAALQREPTYIPARLALGETLFKSGHEEEAEKEYIGVLSIEANQPNASLGVARIELQRGDDDAAVARLEELMAEHPDFAAGAALFAQVLERRGESDRAVAMGQLSQQKPGRPPADPWLDALLADCYDVQRLSLTFEEYFKLGRMDEAVPILDRLAVLDPDGPITKMFSGFSHAKALQHITAVREYYEALGRGGDPEKIGPYLVQSLLALEKASEAAKVIAGYYEKMPDSIPIAKAYAEVATVQGDDTLARELLKKVLQREPYLAAQNMSLAKILWTAGEHDAAIPYLQKVAAASANDIASRALLGEYYLAKSDPESAIKPLEEASVHALAKSPAAKRLLALLGLAYVQVGNVAAEKGRLAEAVTYYDQAIQVGPDDLAAYAGKAGACVQLNRFDDAAAALEKMTGIQPDNPTIFLSLGDVRYQGGKVEKARADWQKALQLVAAGDRELRTALGERLNGHITPDTFK